MKRSGIVVALQRLVRKETVTCGYMKVYSTRWIHGGTMMKYTIRSRQQKKRSKPMAKNNKGQEFAEAMKLVVPHCDSIVVQYALACAAYHFGIYSKATAISDVARSMFGRYISAKNAKEASTDDWQWMETAPKDRPIMLYSNGRRFIGRWIYDSAIHKRNVWMIDGGDAIEPTLWRELPPLPRA
jgi:hypothetical protein